MYLSKLVRQSAQHLRESATFVVSIGALLRHATACYGGYAAVP